MRPPGHIALVCLLLGLAACGGDASTDAPQDPGAVARRAWSALRSADLEGVLELCDVSGREALARDLSSFRQSLARPSNEVPGLARVLSARFARDAESVRRKAAQASDADLLRLLVRLRPLPEAGSPQREAQGEGWQRFVYRDGLGVQRPLRLEQRDGRWWVASLQL